MPIKVVLRSFGIPTPSLGWWEKWTIKWPETHMTRGPLKGKRCHIPILSSIGWKCSMSTINQSAAHMYMYMYMYNIFKYTYTNRFFITHYIISLCCPSAEVLWCPTNFPNHHSSSGLPPRIQNHLVDWPCLGPIFGRFGNVHSGKLT